MKIQSCELREANDFVARFHRHHKPVVGHRFSTSIVHDSGQLCGVAIVGRPRARAINHHDTVEVLRVCTDGTSNACSKLYGAVRRAAFALGYRRIITYTLTGEGGASLRGSGWILIGEAGGGTWNRESRRRIDRAPTSKKHLWECLNSQFERR